MAENTLRPYGWRGAKLNLDQRPVKDEAETSTDGTFGSDAQVPDENGPMVTAALERKHVDASGSTEHHKRTPGSPERTGKEAPWDNEFAVSQPPGHRQTTFREIHTDNAGHPDSSDFGGENEAADSPKFTQHGRNTGPHRRPRLSEPGYRAGQREPLADRKTEAHPIFDRALVHEAVESKHKDSHGSTEHHKRGGRQESAPSSGPTRKFNFDMAIEPDEIDYWKKALEDKLGGKVQVNPNGPSGWPEFNLEVPADAEGIDEWFEENMGEDSAEFEEQGSSEEKDLQTPSGARPGQPAEHLHVGRPSQAQKALDLAQSVVRKFTAGPAAIALSDEPEAKEEWEEDLASTEVEKDAPNVFRDDSRYSPSGGQGGGMFGRRPNSGGFKPFGTGSGGFGSGSAPASKPQVGQPMGGRRAGQPSGSFGPKRNISY